MPESIATLKRPAVIVLAAGVSSRMGRAKRSLPFRGDTFLGRLIKIYQQLDCHPIVVVLSGKLDAAHPDFEDVKYLLNPRPDDGPLSSVKLALDHLPSDCPGYFIHPVDHPAVRSQTLTLMLETLQSNPTAILKPTFEGRGGHPLLLSKIWREEVLKLPLASNLRELLHVHSANVTRMPVDDPGILLNINNPEQYQQLLKLYPDV